MVLSLSDVLLPSGNWMSLTISSSLRTSGMGGLYLGISMSTSGLTATFPSDRRKLKKLRRAEIDRTTLRTFLPFSLAWPI